MDSVKVALKRGSRATGEISIISHLSTDSMRSDPRNHTIPLFGIIDIPDDSGHALLVMPYVRQFHKPAFHCRAEFIEALRQFLEVWLYNRDYFQTIELMPFVCEGT
jgi:hypothetical protein